MAQIEVRVPGLMREFTEGQRRFPLEAATLEGAIAGMLQKYPQLRIHLYTERGELRPHVLLFYNDDNIKWLDRLDIPLKPGDCLSVVQAVSGGA